MVGTIAGNKEDSIFGMIDDDSNSKIRTNIRTTSNNTIAPSCTRSGRTMNDEQLKDTTTKDERLKERADDVNAIHVEAMIHEQPTVQRADKVEIELPFERNDNLNEVRAGSNNNDVVAMRSLIEQMELQSQAAEDRMRTLKRTIERLSQALNEKLITNNDKKEKEKDNDENVLILDVNESN
jgi:hypothetical protein